MWPAQSSAASSAAQGGFAGGFLTQSPPQPQQLGGLFQSAPSPAPAAGEDSGDPHGRTGQTGGGTAPAAGLGSGTSLSRLASASASACARGQGSRSSWAACRKPPSAQRLQQVGALRSLAAGRERRLSVHSCRLASPQQLSGQDAAQSPAEPALLTRPALCVRGPAARSACTQCMRCLTSESLCACSAVQQAGLSPQILVSSARPSQRLVPVPCRCKRLQLCSPGLGSSSFRRRICRRAAPSLGAAAGAAVPLRPTTWMLGQGCTVCWPPGLVPESGLRMPGSA